MTKNNTPLIKPINNSTKIKQNLLIRVITINQNKTIPIRATRPIKILRTKTNRHQNIKTKPLGNPPSQVRTQIAAL